MFHAAPLLLLAASPLAHAGGWRVVGGSPVTDGSWPDAVALFAGPEFMCTGVLVAPDVVLTAAHCDYGLTRAVVGARDWTTDGESIDVADTTSHPQSWRTYDVAVVVLEHAAQATPRAIALDCLADDWLVDGADVEIVGFGATDAWATEDTTRLHAARAVVEDADCSWIAEGCNTEVSPGGEMIAGGGGIDSCNGDSGGPLYVLTDEGDFLAATTSRATLSANVPCGDGGIYVRADAVAEWIEETTGRTLTRPDCTGRNQAPRPWQEPAFVAMGGAVEIVVHAEDPDPDDQHAWSLIHAPRHGVAVVRPDGRIAYVAGHGEPGRDEFVVEVFDDGEPAKSALLTVEVTVEPASQPGGRCGCGGGAGPSWLAPLAVLALRRRRP